MAAVTGLKSDQNQLVDVIRRVVSNKERPNPKPEIQDILAGEGTSTEDTETDVEVVIR